jgi:hypothetical protein
MPTFGDKGTFIWSLADLCAARTRCWKSMRFKGNENSKDPEQGCRHTFQLNFQELKSDGNLVWWIENCSIYGGLDGTILWIEP